MYRLHHHGIAAVLSVRAEDDPEDSPAVAKRNHLRYQRVVVADGVPIPLEALEEIVRLVRDWRRQGLGVLVHCQAGRRRGPIAAAAILIDEGWSFHTALQQVATVRKQTAPTPEQLASLRRFARHRWRHRLIRTMQGLAAVRSPASHPHMPTPP